MVLIALSIVTPNSMALLSAVLQMLLVIRNYLLLCQQYDLPFCHQMS